MNYFRGAGDYPDECECYLSDARFARRDRKKKGKKIANLSCKNQMRSRESAVSFSGSVGERRARRREPVDIRFAVRRSQRERDFSQRPGGGKGGWVGERIDTVTNTKYIRYITRDWDARRDFPA